MKTLHDNRYAIERLRLAGRILCALMLLSSIASSKSRSAVAYTAPTVEPEVWEALSAEGFTDVLLILSDQPDLTTALGMPSKESRGSWVYSTLSRVAATAQSSIMSELERLHVPYQRHWIVNAISVRLNEAQLNLVLKSAALTRVVADLPSYSLDVLGSEAAPGSTIGPEWGVQRVEAPWAWSQGITGAGVVVAGQDTGVAWDHASLMQAYRGYDAVSGEVDHRYNWRDAIHSNLGTDVDNPCGFNNPTPCDDTNHGTHTMGTIVGNDLARADPNWPGGAVNAIGVAPGAEWIGCRNMEAGVGRPSTYIECFEWFVAPYPPEGDAFTEGRPDLAPDIINNSWGCPSIEGCYGGAEIQAAVDAATSAGILVVASIGNTGPACGSVSEPPALYPSAWTIGAVADGDGLYSASSRGPLTWNGESMTKPDVTAPGVSVRSSLRSGGYGLMSGTSTASPHAAGVAALLLSADLRLRGHPEMLRAILERTAEARIDTKCGADSTGVPNNGYGWGIVNARRAIESLHTQGWVTGTVRAADTGLAVAGALVKIASLDDSAASAVTISDSRGTFSLLVDWGAYSLVVGANGYRTEVIEPQYAVGGQSWLVNVNLNKVPEPVSDLTVGRVGQSIQLTWSAPDGAAERFEIWHGARPYFAPGVASSGSLRPSLVIDVGANGEATFTLASTIGLEGINSYYVVVPISSSGVTGSLSNRVGEFDFPITP